ncbi:hypothetical protein Pla175_30850 [Pirellulimonas nuda]|uniref:Oxidoreductase family, NAD-binding Rossmann fold n=1 Tax=Pirellulimonas nuda TaxID=2528009 RepID=A0A518DDY3_9BACT|nr:gfo/Idh/MocA family oxidoreductase [Pirellulimonas nuda]QDU89690.1 hypothetical protein Pla175_30850 [Pirellulimonas nuda]
MRPPALDRRLAACLLITFGLLPAPACSGEPPEPDVLRVGIVGCDTSHAVAFAQIMNDPAAVGACARVEVTAAFPGGSPDIPSSRDRVAGYVDQLHGMGVEITQDLSELAASVDAILLESVDGRTHLPQFRTIAVGKPVFIDKPASDSVAGFLAIREIAGRTNTPIFSSSALRYCQNVASLQDSDAVGRLVGVEVAAPMALEPHHPDLFWYGIHGVESLYALLGPECLEVTRVAAGGHDVSVGTWSDGRVGVYRGLKQGRAGYAFTAYGENGINHSSGFSGYDPLVEQIAEFFVTRRAPVSPEETTGILAFMEAADESRRLQAPVKIETILQRAQSAAEGE